VDLLIRQATVILSSLQHCSGCIEKIDIMMSTIRLAGQMDLEHIITLAWKFYATDLIELRQA